MAWLMFFFSIPTELDERLGGPGQLGQASTGIADYRDRSRDRLIFSLYLYSFTALQIFCDSFG